MKYLLTLFLFAVQTVFAQTEGPLIGFFKQDCYRYTAEMLARQDTSLKQITSTVAQPGNNHIYIFKTQFVDSLPSSINGYDIICLDAESNKTLLYQAQKDSNAAIFYISKVSNLPGPQQYITVMPVQMEKKCFGKKKILYESRGYKVYYTFENALNQYRFKRAEYFDYTESGKKKS